MKNYIVENTGPDDQGYGPRFPSGTGLGMLSDIRQLVEGRAGLLGKPKKAAKKINKEAMGRENVGKKAKLKTSKKPENLRVKGKKKKVGPFGEAYAPPSGNSPKGVRVTESMRSDFRKRFRAFREAVKDVRLSRTYSQRENPWMVNCSGE